MSTRTFLAIALVAILAFGLGAQGRNEKPEQSPHADALAVIFASQQKPLRDLDDNDWWHDTKERTWTVKRPFAPGTIDSTHMFVVSYRIDNKEVASWHVDTRKRTVQAVPLRK
jgi:hypothetical protein